MAKTIEDRIAELQALKALSEEYGYNLIDRYDGIQYRTAVKPPSTEMSRTDPTDEEIQDFMWGSLSAAERKSGISARELSHRLGYYNPRHVKHTSYIMKRCGGKRVYLNGGNSRLRKLGCDVIRFDE